MSRAEGDIFTGKDNYHAYTPQVDSYAQGILLCAYQDYRESKKMDHSFTLFKTDSFTPNSIAEAFAASKKPDSKDAVIQSILGAEPMAMRLALLTSALTDGTLLYNFFNVDRQVLFNQKEGLEKHNFGRLYQELTNLLDLCPDSQEKRAFISSYSGLGAERLVEHVRPEPHRSKLPLFLSRAKKPTPLKPSPDSLEAQEVVYYQAAEELFNDISTPDPDTGYCKYTYDQVVGLASAGKGDEQSQKDRVYGHLLSLHKNAATPQERLYAARALLRALMVPLPPKSSSSTTEDADPLSVFFHTSREGGVPKTASNTKLKVIKDTLEILLRHPDFHTYSDFKRFKSTYEVLKNDIQQDKYIPWDEKLFASSKPICLPTTPTVATIADGRSDSDEEKTERRRFALFNSKKTKEEAPATQSLVDDVKQMSIDVVIDNIIGLAHKDLAQRIISNDTTLLRLNPLYTHDELVVLASQGKDDKQSLKDRLFTELCRMADEADNPEDAYAAAMLLIRALTPPKRFLSSVDDGLSLIFHTSRKMGQPKNTKNTKLKGLEQTLDSLFQRMSEFNDHGSRHNSLMQHYLTFKGKQTFWWDVELYGPEASLRRPEPVSFSSISHRV